MQERRFSKAARLELLIYCLVALLMIACSWMLHAFTTLPTWLAIILGCVAAVVLALLFNLAWAMAALFRGRSDR